MWHLAVREDDLGGAQAMLERYHGSPPWSYRAFLAHARRDPAEFAVLLEEARGAENRQMQIAARYLMAYSGDFAAADSILTLELQWRQRPAIRQSSRLMKAWLEIGRGRWSAAREAFRAAESEGASRARVETALAATLPFLVIPPTELRAVRAEIEAWRPENDPEERSALATALRPHLRVALLGLLSSRLGGGGGGEEAAALRYAAELERAQPPALGESVVQGLARTVRADVAWQGRKPREVIRLLGSSRVEVPLELVSVPLFTTVREYTQEHARYLLAAALTAQGGGGGGETSEARRWLSTGFQGAPNEFAYLAPISRLMGEVLAHSGDRAGARSQYERFVRLWENAEGAERWVVEEVKGRLAGLRP